MLYLFLFLTLGLIIFTVATTLCGSWTSPWFQNSRILRGRAFSPTAKLQPGGLGTTLRLSLTPFICLAWVAQPVHYAPASIAVRVTGENILGSHISRRVVYLYPSSFVKRGGSVEQKLTCKF